MSTEAPAFVRCASVAAALTKAAPIHHSRVAAALFAVLLAVTLWRVASTYEVFSHTVDEPAHIAAGMQFFQKGRVEGDLVQAPLARLFVAAGPYLVALDETRGCRIDREEKMMQCEGERYWRTLAAARLGTLPFLVLLLTVVWRWGTRLAGPAAGLLAAALLANTPPVLAHAGLATTDLAAAATMTLALFLVQRWLEGPSAGRAAAVGAAAAVAFATKLSALAYLPLAAAALAAALAIAGRAEAARRLGPAALLGQALIGAASLFLVWWGLYGFAIHPYPLVEVVGGLVQLAGMAGGANYFLGEIHPEGVWYFFPVMLAVKTPLALIALIAAGFLAAARGTAQRGAVFAWGAAAAAILAVGMASRINLGLRHVLAVYPLLCLVAASGVVWLLRRRASATLAAALALWLVVDSAAAHPDYLPYFNLAARNEPAWFSADSDFDWGQDAKRLADELQRRGIDHVAVAVQSTARLRRFSRVDAADLWPGQRVSGWVAVGIGRLLHDRIRPPYTGLRWLLCRRPVARIGRTILLYEIPPGSTARPRESCGTDEVLASLGG